MSRKYRLKQQKTRFFLPASAVGLKEHIQLLTRGFQNTSFLIMYPTNPIAATMSKYKKNCSREISANLMKFHNGPIKNDYKRRKNAFGKLSYNRTSTFH